MFVGVREIDVDGRIYSFYGIASDDSHLRAVSFYSSNSLSNMNGNVYLHLCFYRIILNLDLFVFLVIPTYLKVFVCGYTEKLIRYVYTCFYQK